ncbi:MAG: hypothetical protein ABIQ01_12630 [Pseudolysinimonas sp.]
MQAHDGTRTPDAMANVAPLAIWTLAWLATLALANFGPKFLWDYQPVAGWVAVAANLVVGLVWIVAHARYLRGLDDLQRKIMLEAMAIGLGVGVVGGFAYAAASNVHLIAFDASIAIFSALTAVVYLVAIAAGNLRYR